MAGSVDQSLIALVNERVCRFIHQTNHDVMLGWSRIAIDYI
jgi:hypothetical protein